MTNDFNFEIKQVFTEKLSATSLQEFINAIIQHNKKFHQRDRNTHNTKTNV